MGQITFFKDAGGLYWGWLLLLFGVLWLIRGSKLRRRALTVSAGYHAFNDDVAADNAVNAPHSNSNSNASVEVAVDSNVPSSSSSMAPAALHEASSSRLSQPLIRNAVPPSPFASCQGNELYALPSIPMISTKPIPAETLTTHTKGRNDNEEEEENEENEEKIVNTHDQYEDAEDSIYVEETEEQETPSGGPDTPERKTSEGNTTMC